VIKQSKMNTLEKNKVIVAGGSSGIGLALVEMLVQANATVVVTGRNKQKLDELQQRWPAVQTAVVDSGNRAALDAFFARETTIDHLVITVSGGKGAGMFNTLSLDDLRSGFEGKFWPQLHTMQAALPYIKPTGSITLVTAASSGAKLPGTSGLAAINGALELMVPILARELKPVRVNAVSPGVIDTPWWSFLDPEAKRQTFEQLSAQVPAGRIGQPAEVADTIRFVVSNAYINGMVIGCHGGL
jgi:NAD(P)-dependent dehydrogenase (short-subunit alcohol dehydrogenase family)